MAKIISDQITRKPSTPYDWNIDMRNSYKADGNRLLQINKARRFFKLSSWVSQNDYYVYQQVVEGKSGPTVEINGSTYWMVSSYDYLGLIGNSHIQDAAEKAIERYGTGTGGVRLLTGTNNLHCEFEKDIASFKGTEASITFASGYVANIAAITTLFSHNDVVVVDSCAHRSIFDACSLAGVRVLTFNHNDMYSLEDKLATHATSKRTLIIVEGVYSMDGDICPLPDIIDLKNKYNAFLMVDEAHSFGVLGRTGRGINEYFNLPANEIDIWMGSLSKAIPSSGGFLAGSKELIFYLQHNALPYIFSAALSPACVAAARESIRIIHSEPQRIDKLNENSEYLRNGLKELGYNAGSSNSHVIPVIVKSDETAFKLARELFGLGVVASPIIFPAVPHGEARLRVCSSAAFEKSMLAEILLAFKSVGRTFRISKNVLSCNI